MTMIIVAPLPKRKEKAAKAHAVQLTKATKSSKVQAALAPRFGMSTKQVQRVLNDAEATYEAWRKEGFRGAWWKRYFKTEVGGEAGS